MSSPRPNGAHGPARPMDANDAHRAGTFDPSRVELIATPPGRTSAYGGAGPTRTAEEARSAAAAPADPELARALEELRSWSGVDGASVLRPVDAVDLLRRTFDETPWLVTGLVTRAGVFVIGGEPKSTKTWCGAEICVAVALGRKAFGEFHAQQGAVAMFLAEDSDRSARNRLRALGMSDSEETRGLVSLYVRQTIDLAEDLSIARIIASVRALPRPVSIVYLDPLRDHHRGDENSSTDMAKVTRSLRALRDILECTVIFVHHSHKASQDSALRRPGQRLRGSSVVHGGVDGGLYLGGLETDNRAHWHNTAVNELRGAQSAGEFGLALDLVDDKNGEAIGATWTFSRAEGAATVEAEAAEVPEAQISKLCTVIAKLSRRERVTRNLLREHFREIGCAKNSVGRVVSAALASNQIAEVAHKGQGGGTGLRVLTTEERARAAFDVNEEAES